MIAAALGAGLILRFELLNDVVVYRKWQVCE